VGRTKLPNGWGFFAPAVLFALAASACPFHLWTDVLTGGMYDPFSGSADGSPILSMIYGGFAILFAVCGGFAGYRKAALVISMWGAIAPIAAFIALNYVSVLPDG